MRCFNLGILISILCCNFLKAQGESAVPFVTIQPSPGLNGMAGAYTALPTHDTFGFFYNPAQTGYFSSVKQHTEIKPR
ncbi:MAG: hypothetical protein P8X42_09030 [Calditrichaceae bacterium]